MIQYQKQNNMFFSTLINGGGVFSGYTERSVGDGRHVDTILSYLRINQVIFKKLVLLEQIHSSNVYFFKGENASELERLPEVDGVISEDAQIVFAVRTADCIPILYRDIKKGFLGISHNGWRGTYKKIGQHMLSEMIKRGSEIDDIHVALGPGIGSCCYDIDEDRHIEFLEEYGEDFNSFPIRGGQRHLNLLRLNVTLLIRAGLPKKNIDFFPFCTSCNKEKFFSFRRDYKKHPEQFGEMFSFIVKNT